MKILIADDSAISLKLLKTVLQDMGHTVSARPDGEAALRSLTEDGSPDVAIIDWDMPKMSGIDVLKEIKKTSPHKHIIMLTAKERKEDLEQAIAADADDYLRKPLSREDLLIKLRLAERIMDLRAQIPKNNQAHEPVVDDSQASLSPADL